MDDPVPRKKARQSKQLSCQNTTINREVESENAAIDLQVLTQRNESMEDFKSEGHVVSEVSLQSQSSQLAFSEVSLQGQSSELVLAVSEVSSQSESSEVPLSEVSLKSQLSPVSSSHTMEENDEDLSSERATMSQLTDAFPSQSSMRSELDVEAVLSDHSSDIYDVGFEEYKAKFLEEDNCASGVDGKKLVKGKNKTVDTSTALNESISPCVSCEDSECDSDSNCSSHVSEVSQHTAERSITSQHGDSTSLSDSEPESEAQDICMVFEGSSLSRREAIMKLMELYFSNSGSKKDFNRTYSTLFAFLPKIHSLPSSVFMLFKEVLSHSPLSDKCTKHYYCNSCVMYQGLEYLVECENPACNGTEVSFFYHFNLCTVIKSLFENRNLADAMDSMPPSTQIGNNIKDIVDGLEYKITNANRRKYDITLISNSDGVRLRSSSTQELWLLIIMPIEVPPHLRQSYATILSIWCDNPKPNMNTFLKPYVNDLKNIFENSVEWTHPKTGEVHLSKVISPLFVADAPARANIMNMMSFNGRYGCNVCEIKTVRTQRQVGMRRVRVYRYADNVRLREHNRTKLLAMLASQEGNPQKGIKGPCVLGDLPYIKYGKFLFPEYLHSVLLGVTRQVCTLWFEKAGDWNCSGFEFQINAQLSSIRVPDFFNRLPRPLLSRKFWKASEWFNWLIYYSVPIMSNFLEDPFFSAPPPPCICYF